MRKLFFLMVTMVLINAKANAQTAVTTAGGDAGTMSFTVGQIAVEPSASDKGNLTPGVQQAYEITIVESGVAGRQVTLEAAVYPNPTADWLTLTVADNDVANLHYTLLDANSRALATSEISDVQTQIDMAALVPAVYFLRIDDGNVMVRTFKIIKN